MAFKPITCPNCRSNHIRKEFHSMDATTKNPIMFSVYKCKDNDIQKEQKAHWHCYCEVCLTDWVMKL